jgi:predicted flap endonuclease-1-like 5' DNA nuclease
MLEHFESPVLPEPEPLILPLHDVQVEDLKIVEGIGPKIEALLMKNNIRNYQELAAAPVDRLREILSQAGPQYALHDPGTWSAQALLAANGEWENLKAYQEFLDAGKRPK